MVGRMDRSAEISAVAALLNRSGGYADRRSLVKVIGRHGLDRVLGAGVLRRVARGLYASPHSAASPAQLAARHSAVLTGLSAAKHLGWELLRDPPIVEAAVRHHRPLRWVKGIRLRRRTFRENEIHEGICTAPLRTVLDCAATLPMDEAVSVADSALRHGDVDPDDLRTAALSLPTRIRRRVLRVVDFASGAAANPSPAGFPKVQEDTQKARDGDRRHILEQELAGEQRSLEQARKELAEQEALRTANDGRQDRILPYKDRVGQHERNIQAIQKELSNLK